MRSNCWAGAIVVLLVVSLAFLALGPFGTLASARGFPDVPEINAYHEAVVGLSTQGVISGYANGDFGPDDPVTRQQFAKMVVLAAGYPVSEADVCLFADVQKGTSLSLYPDHYVAVAAARHIVEGTGAQTFSPQAQISRYQAISMVVRAIDDVKPGLLVAPAVGWAGTAGWGDSSVHSPNARRAEHGGLLAGLPLSTLSPWGSMNRGEVAQLLWNGLQRLEGQNPLVAYRAHGFDFGPYVDGQHPNRGSLVSEAQLLARMQVIKPYATWVRTYGCTSGLEKSGAIAHQLGLQVALGAWIGSDLAANEREIANLLARAKAGEADMLIVGSEVLLRGDVSEAALIAYINRARQAVPGIPVACADVYSELLAHPKVMDAADVVLPNYYPYWEGIGIDKAMAALQGWHQRVVKAAHGKPVMVGETGWPSDGNKVGQAVASPENAAYYFRDFVSWARANDVDYFYFEAFDESWKAAYEGPQGAHWGVWDRDGNLKTGMERVFAGETVPDNWSSASIPGGPGTPILEFTYVPPQGSYDNLVGQVWHIKPADYAVAVYIKVGGGWWTKPYWERPLTTIQSDGSWVADITTGGIDSTATKIAAFLVPIDYDPPLMSGGGALPVELSENAVAETEVTRGP